MGLMKRTSVYVMTFAAYAFTSACAMTPEHEKSLSRPTKSPASVTDSASATAPIVTPQNETTSDGMKVIFDNPKSEEKPVLKAEAETKAEAWAPVGPNERVDTAPTPPIALTKSPKPAVATPKTTETVVTEKAVGKYIPKADQVDPETSLRWLQHGNSRFVKHTIRDDGQSSADRARLLAAQHPHAVVLACSDSRVPPELIFDQKLGEVLVVRTAGEAVDHASLASIEDAVEHQGARLILVLGHESCDTVEAAVKSTAKNGATITELSPAMAATLESIKTRFVQTDFSKTRDVASVGAASSNGASSVDLNKASEENATGAAHDLVKQSDVLKRLVESGQVQIHSALYHMKSGAVTFY